MALSSLFTLFLTLPLIVNIVIPLCALCCWLLFQPAKLLLEAPPLNNPNEVPDSTQMEQEIDQRIEPRVLTQDIPVKVADEHGVYNGIISNISKAGVCLKNLPDSLSASTKRLSVIVKDKTEDYCFFLAPSWDKQHQTAGRQIGGEISQPPKNWLEFVYSH